MNLRYAAALALLAVWYLTMLGQQGDFSVYGRQLPPYATKAECEKARAEYLRKRLRHGEMLTAQCVKERSREVKGHTSGSAWSQVIEDECDCFDYIPP